MANPTVDVATGTTVTFGTSGFSCEILDITRVFSYSRGSIDTTHQGTTTARTFMPTDLYDGGEMDFAFHFDAAQAPPISAAEEVITIALPSGQGVDFTAFLTGYEAGAPLEDKMTGTATLKISGVIDQDSSS